MRTIISIVAILIALPLVAQANGRHLAKADRHLNDALAAAENDSRHCRRAVLRDLHDIVDEMSDRLRLRELERVERDLRSLEKAANRECSRRVRRNLEDGKRHLGRAIDLARRDRKDARDARRGPRIDCWNPSDQACAMTRDSHFPMQRVPFHNLVRTFQKTRSNLSKGDLMKQVAKNNYFTTMQLTTLLKTTRSDLTRSDMVKYAAHRIVDPRNAFVLRNATRSTLTADDIVKKVTRAARNYRP